MTFTPEQRELVQFSYELSLSGIADVALKMYEHVMADWDRQPDWRFLRRRRLQRVADMWVDLYRIAKAYEREQAEAAKAES